MKQENYTLTTSSPHDGNKQPANKRLVIAMRWLLMSLLTFALIPEVSAQVTMTNGSSSTCSNTFYDSGGASSNYGDNESYTYTFYPSTTGAPLKVVFSSFQTEAGYDYLYIYNGNSTSAPLIGTYNGTTSPGTVVSSAADGSLTFKFTSDVNTNYSGWAATVSCLPVCSGAPTAGTAVASTTSACFGVPITFSLSGATTASGLTYEWDTSSTGTSGWAAISGATGGSLSFVPPGGRTLYYRCIVTCTSASSSSTSTTVSVAVGTALAPPYTETFESTTAGTNVACASAFWNGGTTSAFEASSSYGGYYWRNANSTYSGYSSTNHTPGGSNYLVTGYYMGAYAGYPAGYWFTPGIALQSGKTYRFSYWYRVGDYYASSYGSYGADFGMYYSTSQTLSSLVAIKPDITGTPSATYQQSTGDFSVPTTGVYYIALKANNRGYSYYGGCTFDDLGLVELPNCNTATSSTFSTGGTASASPSVICGTPGTTTLSVSGTPAFTGLTFDWQRDVTSSFSSPTSIGSTLTLSATISTAGTYFFRCKITCAATGLSVYSTTTKVTTTPITPPYIEDFEGGTTGTNLPCAGYTYGWSSGAYWYLQGAPYASYAPGITNHTTGGSKYLHAGYYLGTGSGQDEYWFTPGLALTASKAYNVSFWYSNSAYSTGYSSYATKLGVRAGTSQSSSGMSIIAGADTNVYINATTSPTYDKLTRGFIAPTTGTYYVGILVNHSYYNYYGMAIDDIGVNVLPPCSAKPSAGTAVATPSMICSTGSTTLTLKGVAAASDLNFQWFETNSTGGSALLISGATGLSYTTPVLTTGPKYYRCVVTCTAISAPNSDTSSVVTINVGPITPPYIETFETATPGVNQPCASNTGSWDAGAGTSYFYYWGIKGTPGVSFSSVANHTTGGSKYLSAGMYVGTYGLGSPTGDQQYWFSPPLLLTADMSYKCSYWYVTSGYTYMPGTTFGLYFGTSQSASAMTAMTPDIISENNTSYKQIIGAFSAPTTGVYYLGVKVNNNYGYYGIAVDDIGVEQLPLCAAKPTAGTVGSSPSLICSTGSAVLSLTGTSMASKLKFQWYVSTAGATGPFTAVSTGSGGTTAVYTTPTLSTKTWYRCVVTCPLVSAPNTDTTAVYAMNVGALTPPYIETFESSVPGTNVPCAGATAWGSTTYFYTSGSTVSTYGYTDLINHTTGGSKFLVGGYGLGLYTGSRDYWFTPGINLVGGSTYEFSYWYLPDGYGYYPIKLGAGAGTSQSSGAMSSLSADFVPSNGTYQQYTGKYVAPSTGIYYFGIYAYGDYAYGVALDDIGVIQLPPCSGKPSSGGTATVTPSMLCSSGSATFTLGALPKVANLSFQWWECDATGNLIASLSGVLTAPSFTSTVTATKYYRCVVKCSLSAATDTTYSSIVKLDVGAVTPPYIETFESGTPGVNMPCASYSGSSFGYSYYWNVQGAPVSSYSYGTLINHTAGGGKYLIGGYYIGYPSYSGGAPYDFWFTPAIKFTAGKLYQLSYFYQTDGYSGCTYNLAAFMGSSQSPAAMTTAIGAPFSATNTAYKLFKNQFTASATGNYYIGIRKGSAGFGYGVAIDDIGLQEVPPCSAPVVAGTITPDPVHICASGGSSILDLTGSTLATGLTYEWFSAPAATGPYTTTGGTTVPYTTDPLVSNTWFRAVVKCSATGATDTSAPFMMGVGGFDLPYSEDFESTPAGGVPLCSDATKWGSYYDSWAVYNSNITGDYKNHTPGGKNYLIAGYYLGSPSSTTEDNYWFTPGFNLRGGYKYNLSFYYVCTYSTSYKTKMGVYIGKSQNVSGMTTPIVKYRPFTNSTYSLMDTSFVTGTNGVYYLGFRKSGSNPTSSYDYYGTAFDDINLNYAPCDGKPFAGTINSSVPSGTAKCAGTFMTLTDIGATINLVPGIKYHWQRRGLGGASPITWKGVAGAKDTVLSADTLIGYEYRLAVICGNTNDTAFSVPFQLPAQPAHPAVNIAPAASPVTYCLGDTVKFTATNFSGATYDWMVDSVVVPGWKFSDFGATNPGTVMVRVTSPLSVCPAWSNKVKMNANDPGYTVSITKPSDSIICAGSSVVLTAVSSKAGVTYQWRKDNVNISGATGSTYLVTTGGYYRVMTSDGVSACPAASRNVQIIVKPNPPAVITVPGGTTTACESDGVQLNANVGGYSYEWTRGGSTIVGWTDSAQIVKNSGTYAVKVRTSDGCVTISSTVTVNILPSPVPVITKTTVAGPAVQFSTTFFPSYQWIRNGVDISGANASTYTTTVKGVYKVRVTGTNNCSGESNPMEAMEDFLGISNAGVVNDQIKVYPSPTASKVYIESPIEVKVKVKDMSGRTVYEEQVTKEVDLSKYADGVYLFMISDKSGNELIKQQRVTKFSNK